MREGAKRVDALWEFWDCIIGSISMGGMQILGWENMVGEKGEM